MNLIKKWLQLFAIIMGGTVLVGMLFIFTTIRNINDSMIEERKSYARLCADYLAENPEKGQKLEEISGTDNFYYHVYTKEETDASLLEKAKEGFVMEENEMCLYQTSVSEEMPECIIEVRCDISGIYENSRQMYLKIMAILVAGAFAVFVLAGIWMAVKQNKRR
ncbi:MAG: hypothetical protein J6B06_06250 [Lachnospiraceae bacterium]|nr:hypothetical protein [Lachnospiraceae bacterium]